MTPDVLTRRIALPIAHQSSTRVSALAERIRVILFKAASWRDTRRSSRLGLSTLLAVIGRYPYIRTAFDRGKPP